ncbi:MAG: helix-turn-helix transcriptional regulator [Chloroflexales bacterium]
MSDEYQYPLAKQRRRSRQEWDARRIRALREHMGMTQQQMADELEVRQQTISEWETGTHKPHRSTQKTLTIVAERAGFAYQLDPDADSPGGSLADS